MDLEIQDFYNLYWGGRHVTANTRYLWQAINEPEDGGSLELRRRRASYPNFQYKIVAIYTDYVLFGKPKLEETPAYDVRTLTKEILTHMLVGGWCVTLVLDEGPKVYEAFRVNKLDDGTIEIRGDKFDGNTCLEKIVIVPAGVETDLADPAKSESWRAITVTEDGEQAQDIEEDQLVWCRWNQRGLSLIRDTAPMNVQIYNFYSVLDTLVLHAGVFNTTGPNMGDIKKVAPFTHIPYNQGEAPFQFVSPETQQMVNVREEIRKRILEMASVVGLIREFSEQITGGGDVSGRSMAFQMLDTNATVLQMAKSTESCVNKVGEVNNAVNGGGAGRIELDPLLNPEGDDLKLRRLKDLESIKIDEVVKAAQKQRISITLSELPEGERQKLLGLVDTVGGLAAVGRPELNFDNL